MFLKNFILEENHALFLRQHGNYCHLEMRMTKGFWGAHFPWVLMENGVFFCLGMLWSNYKWLLEASYVYFQTPEDFWVTEILHG